MFIDKCIKIVSIVEGNLVEVFMSGTAAVITPVDKVEIRGQMYSFDKKKQ